MQGQRPACSHFVSPETEEYFGSGRLPIQLIGHWLQVALGLVPFSFHSGHGCIPVHMSLGQQSLRAALAGGACKVGGMAVLLFPLTVSRRSRRQGLHALRAFAAGPAIAP